MNSTSNLKICPRPVPLLFLLSVFFLHSCVQEDGYRQLNRNVEKRNVRQNMAKKIRKSGKKIKKLKQKNQKNKRTINKLKEKNRQLKNQVSRLRRQLQKGGNDVPEPAEEPGGKESTSGTENDAANWESAFDEPEPGDSGSDGQSSGHGEEGTVEPGREKAIQEELAEYGQSSMEENGRDTSGQDPESKQEEENESADQFDRSTVWAQLGNADLDLQKMMKTLKPLSEERARWLARGLSDRNITRRRNVEKIIVQSGEKVFHKVLLERLKNRKPTIQEIRLAGDLHIKGAREPLKNVTTGDSDRTYYKTRALVQVGSRSSLPDLISYLAGDADQLYKVDAHKILRSTTEKNFGYPSALLAKEKKNREKQAAWRQWWKKNGKYLYWDEDREKFLINKKARAKNRKVNPQTGKIVKR